jgi:hypothetical protein
MEFVSIRLLLVLPVGYINTSQFPRKFHMGYQISRVSQQNNASAWHISHPSFFNIDTNAEI